MKYLDKLGSFYFLREMSEHNILALTSRCNCRCLFCSHGNNPPGAAVHYCGHRDYNEVIASLDFLDAKKEVVVGESASTLVEGEPLLYPRLWEVLRALRRKYPRTPVSLTTNGSLLTTEAIKELSALAPISLNLSLNTLGYRQEVMGDPTPTAVAAPPLLQKAGIRYNGSVVALPEVTGWPDVAATMAYLQEHGCETIRLILPGYGGMAPQEHSYDWTERRDKALTLIAAQPGVVLLEPPFYQNNQAVIYGVTPNSAGARAGFQGGDIVLAVNGKIPRNRHEAWLIIARERQVTIEIKRQKMSKSLVFCKEEGACGGLVFENDLDLRRLEEINAIHRARKGKAALCCSTLGRPYLEANLGIFPALENLTVITVPNKYFGGNIGAAGLLTLGDFQSALAGKDFDYVFLPRECLDYRGHDLENRTITELGWKSYFV